jgi:hypothetical protein
MHLGLAMTKLLCEYTEESADADEGFINQDSSIDRTECTPGGRNIEDNLKILPSRVHHLIYTLPTSKFRLLSSNVPTAHVITAPSQSMKFHHIKSVPGIDKAPKCNPVSTSPGA